MPEVIVLRQLLLVLGATLGIVYLFQKLRLPTVIGFLLTGVIIGPHGLKFISRVLEVEALAEIGVVLLLFSIGLEISLHRLLSVQRTVLWGGSLQIILSILIGLLLSLYFDHGVRFGVFYGFLVSLSSTAIVLRIFSDRGEADTLQGRLAAGVLLLQDLSVVPMMLVVPVLAQSVRPSIPMLVTVVGKAVLAVGLIVLVARFVLPRLFYRLAEFKNRELSILAMLFVCLGTALLAWEFGLSLALGAFIAGLLISESEYSHQITADVLPLRNSFSGIFFISVGMLLDTRFVLTEALHLPFLSLLSVIWLKGGLIFFLFWWFSGSVRLACLLGLSLAQIGEFSFILVGMGREFGLLSRTDEQLFLGAAIISMMVTPFLIHWAHALSFQLDRKVGGGRPAEPAAGESMAGHVLVVGYGLNGENLCRVLKEVGIAYNVLDMDPDLVRETAAAQEPISLGDGTRPEVLIALGIDKARVLVVAISDPVATLRIVQQARSLERDLFILVRTRYVAEIDRLYRNGADQVIPEEFETSVEIFARVLQEYHIPRNVIALQVDLIRRERYGMLRGLRLEGKSLNQLGRYLAGTTTDTLLILDESVAVGRTLAKLEIRSKSGVMVIAVVREGQSFQNPSSDFRLAAGDILVLLGSHKEMDQAMRLLSPSDNS